MPLSSCFVLNGVGFSGSEDLFCFSSILVEFYSGVPLVWPIVVLPFCSGPLGFYAFSALLISPWDQLFRTAFSWDWLLSRHGVCEELHGVSLVLYFIFILCIHLVVVY